MVGVDIIRKLPNKLKPISDEQEATAAVALILKAKRGDFDLLFVKRVKNPSDPWSGQMALPGGKRDPRDKNLEETVIRETVEETGVRLNRSSFLGVLTAIESENKPILKILPFVALLEREPQIRLNKRELESFIWVPFEEIAQSKGSAEYGLLKVPAYIFADAIVWGITYTVLSEFTKAVEEASRQ